MDRAEKEKHRKEILERLRAAGVEIHERIPKPRNGRYSAIVGGLQKAIVLKIPDWMDEYRKQG